MSGAPGPSAAALKPIQVKLVLLGEAAVGKSSLVLRFVNGEFQDNKEPTIGAAFLTQKCKLEEKIIKFEIWVCFILALHVALYYRRYRRRDSSSSLSWISLIIF